MSKNITITEDQLNRVLRSAWDQGHMAGVMQNEPNDSQYGKNKEQLFNDNKDWMKERTVDILQIDNEFILENYSW